MYKYETHMHTFPVSKCAHKTVEETLDAYKKKGYDGVFVTNHFLDGNINIDPSLPYREKLKFYLSDFENAVSYGREIKLKVFFGVEMSYYGTDFLVYGLTPEWYRRHPEIMQMKRSDELEFLQRAGAFISQAHPFREASYIDHIRLFPGCVDAVEVINASRTDFENKMAAIYADQYGLLKTAGTDNHLGGKQKRFAGMMSETPIVDENDFIEKIKDDKMKIFFD